MSDDLNINSDNSDSNISESNEIKLTKNEKFWWYRDNENMNYRRPLMYPDDNGHITEYIQ
ncbi:5756_t:CDS:1, partial [Cetraspora pellucida]